MRQSSVGTDRLPAWLSCDLHKLRDDDITTQLEMIFGEEEAQQILNPTVKRSKHQSNQHVLQPAIAKHETQDAHMLWNSLRSISNKKLASQMSANNDTEYIQQNVRFDNNNNNNSWSSRRVDLYRQRVQLMHKVAHMNEGKTKQLLETVKLPALTPSGVDYKWTENCDGYLAEYEIERMEVKACSYFWVLRRSERRGMRPGQRSARIDIQLFGDPQSLTLNCFSKTHNLDILGPQKKADPKRKVMIDVLSVM